MVLRWATLTIFAAGASCANGPAAADPGPASQSVRPRTPEGFWDHWGDGQAEVAGYALTMPRYGELRRGEVVLVTVTETFTDAQRVKSDGGHSDEYAVLKLNTVVDFQTGVYDYNAMTSSFMRLDHQGRAHTPTKITFSMQEWCGHEFEQLVETDTGYDRVLHSYFDGESTTAGLPRPSGAVSEDALLMVLRGLTGPPPEGDIALLPRLMDARLHHRPLAWAQATVHPLPARTLATPAGSREVVPWTLQVEGDKAATYYVDTAPPHRIAGWDRPDGERARLTGVIRVPYWDRNGVADESLRASIGLPARNSVSPGDE